jgi:hypothetical protein
MKRLYYLTHNINAAEKVSDRLHEEGITDWHFHVLGKDKANVIRHHLHSATPLHELDIIRSGERGVMAGFCIGIGAIFTISFFASSTEHINMLAQLAIVALFSFFGAWVGGLVGVSTENHKIRRFHNEIEAGAFLLMIDVTANQKRAVRDLMDEFKQIREAGEDTTLITPFSSAAVR